MSASVILAQLPKLTDAERGVIRDRLDELEMAAPLTLEEKQLIDARVKAYHQNPDNVVSWAVAEAKIRKQLGLQE